MDAAATHTHRAPLGEVITETTTCERCGRLMVEIQAERDARPAKVRTPRVDNRTPELKEADRERRRLRYRLTGK